MSTWVLSFFFVLAALTTAAHGQSITLSFPLEGRTPYDAQINAVLDHSGLPGAKFYCSYQTQADRTLVAKLNREVIAYTGEKGSNRGEDDVGLTCDRDSSKPKPSGFKNPIVDANFIVNGCYRGCNNRSTPILYYDGHSGYDYQCTRGETVLAAAGGTLFVVGVNDPGGIYANPPSLNAVRISHAGGWETWYLHTRVGSNPRSDTTVEAGDPIGACSDVGAGTGVHLHFEVRRNNKVVDPYGWEWNTGDPLSMNSQALVQQEPLWGIPQPVVTNVSLAGFTATITGQNFAPGALVTLWDRYGQFFVQRITPLSVTGSQIVANLPIAARPPEDFVVKVKNPQGPRSKGVALSSSASSSFDPLALIGQPAPGGGTFDSFSTFYGMNNRGEIFFNASVDTNGDGFGDRAGAFKLSGGQFTEVTVPGIGRAGAVRINNSGDMALGSSPAIGVTRAIYFLKSGSSTPTKIVEEGQRIASIPGTTYRDLRGPLAISDNGDVTFSSSAFNASTNTGFCCYLFLYSNLNRSIVKVVGEGDSTPIGGRFHPGPVAVNDITSDGDVIFSSGVIGGSSDAGIFRFSRTQGIRKVVVRGDPAPSTIGGSLDSIDRGSIQSVSGRKLVFFSRILGGSTDQAILVKDDVTVDSLADVRVIAFEGQPTGTEVGGIFSRLDNPPSNQPFEIFGGGPQIRADGGVLFLSLLRGAITGGTVTQKGIFLWTGREFKKVAVEGDRLPSGGILNGVSSHILNDLGQVAYFVARIE
jgi:murein DD-endopeptidase MepM/ murein hydrolase activator NlpD